MGSEELETLEHSIKAAVERNQLLTTKRPLNSLSGARFTVLADSNVRCW